MSYGLRGCGGLYGSRFGLGAVILQPPAYENCNDYDSACVARNQVLSNAYDLAASQDQAQQNMDQCMANAQNATPGAQYDATVARCNGQFAIQNSTDPVAALAAAIAAQSASGGAGTGSQAARGGNVAFTTSRGGNALQVGDTWLVAITGASPNSPVTVSGSMPGGAFSGTPKGSTDANGNFSVAGSVDSSQIGAWSETWSVGGATSGSFAFTVVPPSLVATTGAPASGGTPASAGAVASSGTAVTSVTASSIPWWVWLVAAGGAVFMFGGKGGR
jgi:hypothetical protein